MEHLDSYFAALLVSLLAGVLSQASVQHSAAQLADPHELRLHEGSQLLDRVLDGIESGHATILRRYYLERERLGAIAKELDLSYATIRRRHQDALEAAGALMRRLLAEDAEKNT
jgi:DNA-directed RNA polymerase specialized sigma24 family protein